MQQGISLRADAEARGYPHGFDSQRDFQDATRPLAHSLRAWDPDAQIVVAGSSVAGQSFATGRPFGHQSDYDFAVAISDATTFGWLYGRFPHHAGSTDRTRPVGARDLDQLEIALRSLGERDAIRFAEEVGRLADELRQLQRERGHEVNLMFYNDLGTAQTGRPTITRPSTPTHH